MNKTYIIVGVSSGIGLALAERFLKNGHKVFGVGRKSSIQNQNYTFIELDLSDEKAVHKFTFPKLHDEVLFIYNSGVLGEVLPFNRQSEDNPKSVFQVNYLAAVVLTQKVLKVLNVSHIVYISSGAAKRAIPSWSQYCASKAALDIFAETLQLELFAQDRKLRVWSIAPGVVDTHMQVQIRSTKEEDFASVENFRALYENGELSSPNEVARKLDFVLSQTEAFKPVCLSLRDIE